MTSASMPSLLISSKTVWIRSEVFQLFLALPLMASTFI